MNRSGFAAVIVLLAVFALAVIGGIAYVQYVYVPHGAQNNPVSLATTSSPSAITTTTTSPAQIAVNGFIACGNDIECLKQAVQNNCKAAKGSLEITETSQEIGLSKTMHVDYEVRGAKVGKCAVYKHFGDTAYTVLDSAIQRLMAQGKLTQAQAEAEAQKQLNFLRAGDSAFINTSDVCNFNAQDLAHDFEVLTKNGVSVGMSLTTNLQAATATIGIIKNVCNNTFLNK